MARLPLNADSHLRERSQLLAIMPHTAMDPSFRCSSCHKMARLPMIIMSTKAVCEPCSIFGLEVYNARSWPTFCTHCCGPVVCLADKSDSNDTVCTECLRLLNHKRLQCLKDRLRSHSGKSLHILARQAAMNNEDLQKEINRLSKELQQVAVKHECALKLLKHFRKPRVRQCTLVSTYQTNSF